MFYLKYRPQTIDQIDNSRVREIITRILSADHLPHAFLFVGQKGTGKTSTARILAKAINCLNNKFSPNASKRLETIEPCNHCDSCLAIDHSRSVDIIEMDAASNRGIEDIKKLIHESNFLPMSARYRVFIIDEAHMITPEGFNALLKTLEEPPPSVIFVLATTNKDKLPKTIISRCQVVNFGRANEKDIMRMLHRCAAGEKISHIDEKLLKLIASHSDNSFRDAAKIFEELIIQQKLTVDEAEKYLGFSRKHFLSMIEKKDPKQTLAWVEEFTASGGSIKTLIEQVLDELRTVLLAKAGLDQEKSEETKLTKKEIITLIKLFTEAYQNLSRSPIESLPLEIAVIEFYNQNKL